LLAWSRERRVTFWEMRPNAKWPRSKLQMATRTEALALFRDLIDTLHERGISVSYSVTMASLAAILHRRGDYNTAAVITAGASGAGVRR
jgi:hypothetical protein